MLPLATGLPFAPTALEYCFMQRILYMCSKSGSIVAFKMNSTDPPSVNANAYYEIKPQYA